MCGIAGFTNRSRDRLDRVPSILRELQRHRGPDDFGFLSMEGGSVKSGHELPDPFPGEVGFLHWRLSILDLTSAGWQPMSTEDGRHHLIFNGEIYNYLELRGELEQKGINFRSHSDTEVLLRALVVWGPDCLKRLVGMFAFALLDSKEKTILLARDFFGIKPLYYAAWQHGLAFASEVKALLEFPGVSRRANAGRVHQYLQSGRTDQGPETMFRDIRQLPAAHWMRISLDAAEWPTPVEYWAPTRNSQIDISYDEATRHLRELLCSNIDLHLRSDVPVGAALSGGIDSSLIVSMMRRLLGRKGEIHTFTYVEPNSAVDEEKWADLVNENSTATPHKVYLQPDQLRADCEQLIQIQDQPVAGTSIYAQYAVFRAARAAGIKVMLDGQGGDEIFGGYTQFLGARLASLVRSQKWLQAAQFAARLRRLPGVSMSFVMQMAGAYFLPESLQGLALKMAGRPLEPECLNNRWFRDRNAIPAWAGVPSSGSKRALIEFLSYELTTTSLPSLLRYEDHNSMAHSIESRVPFLTSELVDFAYSLPEDFIISNQGRRKFILRDAMRGIVPEPILERNDKIGFATAELKWMQQLKPWIHSVISSDTAHALPMLLPQVMLKEYEDICNNRQRFNFRIWRWVNFIEWVRQKRVTFD